MDIAQYTDFLNYMYKLEHIKCVIAYVAITICIILWGVLILLPKIKKRNKIGISFVSFALVILLFICIIVQKQTTESILKDVTTKSFVEYEGYFDFKKRDPDQSDHHIVDLYNEETLSLKIYDFIIESDYSVLDENIENGKYYGKIVYAYNSKLIVYIEIENTGL